MMGICESFYNLTTDPFQLSPDHRFSFGHPSYKKAKAFVHYVLQRGEGFVMVTGAPGSGKTTLINDMLSQIDESSVTVVSLLSTRLRPDGMLKMVATALGIPCNDARKSALLVKIRKALGRRHRKRRRVVLVVDEAQDLAPGDLKELQLLSKMQIGSQPLLQIFIVGQEPLVTLVKEPGMEHLRQPIIATVHLDPLSIEDTSAFIQFRMKQAGWKDDPVLTSQALESLYEFSQGVPRRINLICSRLLFRGAVEEMHTLGRSDVQAVIEGMPDELMYGEGLERKQPARREKPPQARPAKPQPELRKQEIPVPQVIEAELPEQAIARSVALDVPAKALEQPNPAVPLSTYFDVVPENAGEPLDLKPAPEEPPRQEPVELPRPSIEPEANLAIDEEGQIRDIELLPESAADLTIPDERDSSSDDTYTIAYPRTNEPEVLIEESAPDSRRRALWILFSIALAGFVGAAAGLYDPDRFSGPRVWERLTAWLEQQGATFESPPGDDATATAPVPERVRDTGVSGGDIPVSPGADENAVGKDQLLSALPDRVVTGTVEETYPSLQPDRTTSQSSAKETEGAGSQPGAPSTQLETIPIQAGASDPAMQDEDTANGRESVTDDETVPRLEAELRVKTGFVPPETPETSEEVADVAKIEKKIVWVTAESGAGATGGQQEVARHKSDTERTRQVPVTTGPAGTPKRPKDEIILLKAGASRISLSDITGLRENPFPGSTVAEVQIRLIRGQWNLSGKPAALLPSETNHCKVQANRVVCWSSPRRAISDQEDTVYQVESDISDFFSDGTFHVRYRIMATLVRVSDSPVTNVLQYKTSSGWKVSEYETVCQIIRGDRIECHGGDYGAIEYRSSP